MLFARLMCVAFLAAPVPAQMLMMGEVSEGFMSLFNGQELGQWDGDPALWHVERGVIIGSTDGVPPLKANSFLVYHGGKFRDFELRLQMRLRNHNSGIQFRSEEFPGWVVKGLQADAAEGRFWGNLHEEGGRKLLIDGWKDKGERVVRPGDWNDYTIYCKGSTLRLTLNGVVTAESTQESPKEGVIAFQLHAGPPMKVEFRNIRIRKLD